MNRLLTHCYRILAPPPNVYKINRPKHSMYGTFTWIYHRNEPKCSNVGKYTNHTLSIWNNTPRKSKTKQRIVFRMIHVKDSLLPRGKVWSTWTSWVQLFLLRPQKLKKNGAWETLDPSFWSQVTLSNFGGGGSTRWAPTIVIRWS